MKFKKGDIVRYREDIELNPDFVEHYGRGPYIVQRSSDRRDPKEYLFLSTLDGEVCMFDSPVPWNCSISGLELDPFLTAVRKRRPA